MWVLQGLARSMLGTGELCAQVSEGESGQASSVLPGNPLQRLPSRCCALRAAPGQRRELSAAAQSL